MFSARSEHRTGVRQEDTGLPTVALLTFWLESSSAGGGEKGGGGLLF